MYIGSEETRSRNYVTGHYMYIDSAREMRNSDAWRWNV